MSFFSYLENKIFYILFQLLMIIVLSLILYVANLHFYYILLIIVILGLIMIGYLIIDYVRLKTKSKRIIELVDSLKEKYYISEIIPKSHNIENQAYIYALKQASKAMNDKLGKLEEEWVDYQEYIESFVHEIKTPISALMISLDDAKDMVLKSEVDKINMLVEQWLVYRNLSYLSVN